MSTDHAMKALRTLQAMTVTRRGTALLLKATRRRHPATPSPAELKRRPAPYKPPAYMLMVALALTATISISALHWLDLKQATLQNVGDHENAQALRAATLGATVRKCLASEPFLLLARKAPEGSRTADSGAAAAPGVGSAGGLPLPRSQAVVAVSVATPAASASASASASTSTSNSAALPLSNPLTLTAMSDQIRPNTRQAFAELENPHQLVSCAYATRELAGLKRVDQTDFWRQVFTEGSSLNTALRLARIILLGVFALCATELLLRLLKLLKLPVMSLSELAKLVNTGNGSPVEADAPKAAAPLLSLLSTVLVTGVTSVAVVVPELAQQASNTTHVLDSKSLDVRNIQALRVDERRLELTRTSETHKETSTTVREVDAEALAGLRRSVDATHLGLSQVLERLRQLEHALPDEAYIKLLTQLVSYQGASEHSARAKELQALNSLIDSLGREQLRQFGAQQTSLADAQRALDNKINDAYQAANAAKENTEQIKRSVHQRGCATLAYFEDVENRRWWPFDREAQKRLRALSNMMQQSGPTADCGGFLSTPAAAAVNTAAK